MRHAVLIASGVFVASFAAALSSPAEAKSMKECAAEWQQMKASNQTAGKTYREFSKECMAGGAGATTPPAAESKPAAEPSAKTSGAKPMSSGRQAMIARERACGSEWKADKAAGKIAAGMKWPQYWSECNKRKKAEGM